MKCLRYSNDLVHFKNRFGTVATIISAKTSVIKDHIVGCSHKAEPKTLLTPRAMMSRWPLVTGSKVPG